MKLLNVSELYSLIEQVVKVIIFNIKFFGAHGNRALRNLSIRLQLLQQWGDTLHRNTSNCDTGCSLKQVISDTI